MCNGNREKEKPYVFRTGIVIFQPSVILFPVRNSKLDKISAGQLTVGDVMFSLEIVEYCQCLMLAVLMNEQNFTSTSKVSFVTKDEKIYDLIKSMQFPLLSLYVSAIRVNGKSIEESEVKTNQETYVKIVEAQYKNLFCID